MIASFTLLRSNGKMLIVDRRPIHNALMGKRARQGADLDTLAAAYSYEGGWFYSGDLVGMPPNATLKIKDRARASFP